MAHCNNCGKKIPKNASFCPSCGAIVGNEEERRIEYAGKLVKCPNCGEALKIFDKKCPGCGYELRTRTINSSVKELSEKLNDIDKRSGAYIKNILKGEGLTGANEKKISAIENFVIPNNKEDIAELMIMAVSNITPAAYSELNDVNMPMNQKKKLRALSDAWISKYEQASQKALLMFPGDDSFANIQLLFDKKMDEIKKEKGKFLKYIGFFFLIMMVIAIFCIIMGMVF